MGRIPIRVRLTLLFALAMATVLAATGAFVYVRLESALDASVDRSLRSRAADGAALLAGGSPLVADDDGLAQVVTPHGTVTAGFGAAGRRPVLSAAEAAEASRSGLTEERRVAGLEEPARIFAQPVDVHGARRVIVVGESLEPKADALESLVTQLLIGGPVALLLASLAAYGLAAAALRPVESMRREAEAVSAAEPGRRLPLPGVRDEVGRLGETLNQMLARLEGALARERRFVTDASHELRTPLAALRTELELALRGDRAREDLLAAIRSAADETDRLSQLAEDLLVLARSDDGRLPVRRERLPVSELLEDVRERYARRVEVHIEADPGLAVSADRLRTEQALGNLVENAIRHGRAPVVLTGARQNGAVRLGVRDAGPGFDPDLLKTAFEPFTRGDAARTGPGAGLGLAIVDVIARAQGGSAHVANRDGGGEAWIELPG